MANVWADKQYYKLISRNRVPFVRYERRGQAGRQAGRPWINFIEMVQ